MSIPVLFPASIPNGGYFTGSNHAWGFTGNALLPDQEEYLEAGVDCVLTKPVREESVRKMLAVADERKKAHSHGGST